MYLLCKMFQLLGFIVKLGQDISEIVTLKTSRDALIRFKLLWYLSCSRNTVQRLLIRHKSKCLKVQRNCYSVIYLHKINNNKTDVSNLMHKINFFILTSILREPLLHIMWHAYNLLENQIDIFCGSVKNIKTFLYEK